MSECMMVEAIRWTRKTVIYPGECGPDAVTMVLSAPEVMRSVAGFYVGKYALPLEENGFPMPYERLTGYYPDRVDAERRKVDLWAELGMSEAILLPEGGVPTEEVLSDVGEMEYQEEMVP